MKRAGSVAALNNKYQELSTKLKGKFTKILVKIWNCRHQYQIILPERSWMCPNYVSIIVRILLLLITTLRMVALGFGWGFYCNKDMGSHGEKDTNRMADLTQNVQAIIFLGGYPILSI